MRKHTPETRVFFELGEGSHGRRLDFDSEDEAHAAIRAGRVRGWEIGFGLYTRAYPPVDAERVEALITGAGLAGDEQYRRDVRDAWRRVAAAHLERN